MSIDTPAGVLDHVGLKSDVTCIDCRPGDAKVGRKAGYECLVDAALPSPVGVLWSAPDVERMRRSYIALTEVMARMPLVLHETRGQPLLAPRSFSREQWSRL